MRLGRIECQCRVVLHGARLIVVVLGAAPPSVGLAGCGVGLGAVALGGLAVVLRRGSVLLGVELGCGVGLADLLWCGFVLLGVGLVVPGCGVVLMGVGLGCGVVFLAIGLAILCCCGFILLGVGLVVLPRCGVVLLDFGLVILLGCGVVLLGVGLIVLLRIELIVVLVIGVATFASHDVQDVLQVLKYLFERWFVIVAVVQDFSLHVINRLGVILPSVRAVIDDVAIACLCPWSARVCTYSTAGQGQ